MNCKYLRKKSKKGQYYFYCLLKKQNVSLTCYRECNSKEYKIYKSISKATKTRSKKEKDRFSIFTPNLSKCIKCGSIYGHIDKHELFPGRNRSNSIKYGFVIPLCRQCHRDITNNYEYINYWKVKAQTYFEKNIGTKEEFVKIFGMDYIYMYKKNK